MVQKGANVGGRRNVLGRGLSALMSAAAVSVDIASRPENRAAFPTTEGNALRLPDPETTEEAPAIAPAPSPGQTAQTPVPQPEALEGGLIYLSIDRVIANKAQPRQHFPQNEIDTLSESIKKTGLLQPIVVRRRGGEMSGMLASYEIVAGERRWRAAKQAGLTKIPAILRQITDREALELGIVENVQRADLNAIEEAIAYQRLADEFGATQAEIAETVSKDRASIANSLRLLKLAPEVQQFVIHGEISPGHARAALSLSDPEKQLALCQQIRREGLSVRATEQLAGAWKSAAGEKKTGKKSTAPKPQDVTLSALEDRLRRTLGTKVKLNVQAEGRGELKISFFSVAELETIVEKLGA